MRLSCTGSSDDVTAYLLDLPKVCGSLGLRTFENAGWDGGLWAGCKPSMSRIAESDKCKGIL